MVKGSPRREARPFSITPKLHHSITPFFEDDDEYEHDRAVLNVM